MQKGSWGPFRRAASLALTGVALSSVAACAEDLSASSSPEPSVSASVSPSPSSSVSDESSIAGLPGWLYYDDNPPTVILTNAGPVPILEDDDHSANVSPDGASIAYVNDINDELVITDRHGQQPRTIATGIIGVGYEPTWSPDSQRLLVAQNLGAGEVALGIITIATGAFTPLANQIQAIHPLWAADGQHIGYATGTCQIGIANIDGSNARLIPILGDRDAATNPERRRSCDPYSISPNATLIAVSEHTGDEPDGDIGRDLHADTIIDTATGNRVELPVTGTVLAIRFQPNGDILVRTTDGTTNQLTLLTPQHTTKAQVTEPPTVANLPLLAYTPN